MQVYKDKNNISQNKSVLAASTSGKKSSKNIGFVDNRPKAAVQRKVQDIANDSFRVKQLKNFDEMAGGYAKGKNVYQSFAKQVASKTVFLKNKDKAGVNINDDIGLEREADTMGAKALQMKANPSSGHTSNSKNNFIDTINSNEPVVQRVLQINDVKKIFENSTDAKKYLEQELLKKNQLPDTGMINRLKDVADVANQANDIYEFDNLSKILDTYIIQGTNILEDRRGYRNPELTPMHHTGFNNEGSYDFRDENPGNQLLIPQSPMIHFGGEEEYPKQEYDIHKMIDERKDDLEDYRTKHAKSKMGKNNYKYSIDFKVRIEHMKQHQDISSNAMYSLSGSPSYFQQSEESPYYTSKLSLPPQKTGDKPVDNRDEIRDTLDDLHANYNHGSFKDTSLFSTERDDHYFRNAGVNKFSSLFVHSEVQAVANKSDADQLIRNAIGEAIQEGIRNKGGLKSDYIRLVFLGATIVGYSDPNSVCGGACKPALTELNTYISEKISEQLVNVKGTKLSDNLFVRRSSQFTVSAHVGSQKEFGVIGKGANKPTGGMTVAQHNKTTEYKPYN